MECLCLRLFCHQDKDFSLMSSHSLIPVPQPGDTEWWASLMIRRAASNLTLLAAFGPRYLHAEENRHIHDWQLSFSTEATHFLYSYDLGCVEELVVWPPLSSGGRVALSPLLWLLFLSASLRPGGPEVHLAIASLLLQHDDRIPRTIPVIREQTYQLFPTSFFYIAGLLPDGRVSGRRYCALVPKRCKHLVLDSSFPSEARGSGFTTSTTLALLASSEVFRVITISRTYSWEVLARCGPPPVPVDPRAPPPAPPVVSPGWGDADWNWPPPSPARINFPIIPSQTQTNHTCRPV
jgi:hypothetical protein